MKWRIRSDSELLAYSFLGYLWFCHTSGEIWIEKQPNDTMLITGERKKLKELFCQWLKLAMEDKR